MRWVGNNFCQIYITGVRVQKEEKTWKERKVTNEKR